MAAGKLCIAMGMDVGVYTCMWATLHTWANIILLTQARDEGRKAKMVADRLGMTMDQRDIMQLWNQFNDMDTNFDRKVTVSFS